MLPTPDSFFVSQHCCCQNHVDFAALSALHHPMSSWPQTKRLVLLPQALGTLSPSYVSALTCGCKARAGPCPTSWTSPFYLGQELGLKDPSGLQPL